VKAPEERIGVLIRDTARLMVQHVRPQLERLDLTFTQYLVVRDLLESGGGISQRVLGENINIAEATLVGIIGGLERRELIIRKRSETDRRNSELFLSPAGRALARKVLKRVATVTDLACVGFSTTEIPVLRSLLTRMKSNLRGPHGTN
jgi:DNA-binding MarR family transcriptional regulator